MLKKTKEIRNSKIIRNSRVENQRNWRKSRPSIHAADGSDARVEDTWPSCLRRKFDRPMRA